MLNNRAYYFSCPDKHWTGIVKQASDPAELPVRCKSCGKACVTTEVALRLE